MPTNNSLQLFRPLCMTIRSTKECASKLRIKKRTLSIILAVTISALMGAFGMIMYLRYRYQKSKTDLLDVNYRLNLLNKACSIKSSNTHHADDTSQSEDNINDDQEITEYRNELNEYIRSLDQLSKKRYSIPESILCSEVYAKLKNAISQNKTLNDNDPIWDELHELIKKVSPDFDKKSALFQVEGLP